MAKRGRPRKPRKDEDFLRNKKKMDKEAEKIKANWENDLKELRDQLMEDEDNA